METLKTAVAEKEASLENSRLSLEAAKRELQLKRELLERLATDTLFYTCHSLVILVVT